MRIKNNIYVKIIAFGSIFMLYLIAYLWSRYDHNNEKEYILKKSILSNAYIYDYTNGGSKYVANIKFTFKVNNVTYWSDRSDSRLESLRSYLVGKSFPVIANAIEPENNEILIFTEDFEDYNIHYPDSLRWVKEILDR